MLYVGEYWNKNHVQCIQAIGTEAEFIAADLPLGAARRYKNGKGEDRVKLSGPLTDPDVVIWGRKANAYVERLASNAPKTCLDWIGSNEMLLEALLNWPVKGRVNVFRLQEGGGLEKPDAKKLMASMYREGWIDGKSLLTRKALDSIKDTLKMKQVLKNKSKYDEDMEEDVFQ